MKNIILLIGLCLTIFAGAQTAITSYNFDNQNPVVTNNNVTGWNSSGTFRSTYNYTNRYGQRSSGTPMERKVIGFTVGSYSFTNVENAEGKPFDVVTVKRHPNVNGQIIHAFYEYTSASPSASGSNYFEAAYEGALENLINSYVVNRGSDNLFANAGASTTSNIERLDLIKTTAITVVAPDRQGFLINERGGNDNFKVAAIKTINGANAATSFGNLVQVTTSKWGKVGPNMQTMVMSRDLGTDNFLRPKSTIASQTLSGVFISFQDLGLAEGTTVYGLSLFPDDVTGSTNLLTLANAPTNTPESASGGGGLDMMAGGGYFVETSVLPVINLQFKAQLQQQAVRLKWQTEREINNAYYEVQRSGPSENWKVIGRVNAGKDAHANYYSFTDVAPLSGKNIYRLKQVNRDGTYTFSENISVTQAARLPVRVYPNPVKDILHLEFANGALTNNCQVAIFSAEGKKVSGFEHPGQQAGYKLNTASLQNGVYTICINTISGQSVQQFVVSR